MFIRNNQLTILYIPGLGRGYDWFRKLCLTVWRLCGVKVAFVPVNWEDGEGFAAKQRLIESFIPENQSVIVIGESAGGAAALAVAANDDSPSGAVKKVVTLCGVARPNAPISARLQRDVPALKQARDQITTLDNVTTSSIVSLYDPIVHSHNDRAAGARVHTLPSIGHLPTIIAALTI